MKTLIGGSVAAVLGLIGLGIFWHDFFDILAGVVPTSLLLGGGLAIYLGFDELKESWKKDEEVDAPSSDDPEKYKKEIDDLKSEIETLKSEKT